MGQQTVLAQLVSSGLASKPKETVRTGEYHHFRFTETEARDNKLYDFCGSRSHKIIKKTFMDLARNYVSGKIDLVIKK